MAANGSPLRRGYASLSETPPELWTMYEAMLDGNAKTLLGLLVEHPVEFALGFYDPESRTITLASALEWQCRMSDDAAWFSAVRTQIHAIELRHAVIALRSLLQQYHRLPFNVWCERVSGVESNSRLRLNVEIGLVDMRQPIADTRRAAALPG